MKLEAIELLTPHMGDSKRIEKAIKKIEKSLDGRLWDDELHLNARRGHKVFSRERNAIKRLMHLLKPDEDDEDEDEDSDDEDEDDRRGRGRVSDEAKAAAGAAIDLLVGADRILAELNIQEAEAACDAGLEAAEEDR